MIRRVELLAPGGNVAKELQLLSEDLRLDREGAGPVVIRTSSAEPAGPAMTDSSDGESDDAPKLVFRALFQEGAVASDWEERVKERLQESGIQVGNEFFFVNGSVLESLCDAAAYADEHEWVVLPGDAKFMQLAMERGRAKRAVDEAFDAWSNCGRTESAEIKINSYTQYAARDERRIKDLQGQYVTPKFFNDAATENSKLDYTISRLKDQARKWRVEIKILREEIDRNNVAFSAWQAALARVAELDASLKQLESGDEAGAR